jgi:ComEC/Rec2-related protein
MPALTVLIWLLSFGFLDVHLDALLSPVSAPLHHACLGILPPVTEWRHLYGAIVCGSTPPPSPERVWFQTTGLYHLLVVSGSHLIFLSHWLTQISRKPSFRPLTLILLGVYCLVCQLAPPVVRAFAQILLVHAASAARLHLSASQISLATGVLCLGLFPGWSGALSFWLSWLASLACAWTSAVNLGSWARVTLIQCLLIPAFGFTGVNLPLSVFSNWILGPLLGKVLFGCALLATLIHPLAPLCDWFWESLVGVLAFLSTSFGEFTAFSSRPVLLITYVGVLNFMWMGVCRWRDGWRDHWDSAR